MKKMKSAGAIAAVLMVGSVSLQAQEPLSTTTKTVKVRPGETETTVITKENGSTGAKKHPVRRHRAVEHHEAVESQTAREIRELREKQAAQQAEIDALTQANAAANAQLAAAQTAAAGAEAQAQTATQQAQSVTSTVQANSDAVAALKSNVTDLQTTNVGLANTISANKVELTDKIESPSALHYKKVTITPVLIVMADGVWRQRGVNSDEATPFNSIPFSGANEYFVTEQNFDGRQSRVGALVEAKPGSLNLQAYIEADFLGAGTTSNNNQSNSYVFRQRQFWGRFANKSGFAITGGQMWSLVAEDAKGTDNRTERNPLTIDPNYMVGYTWARQAGFRIQQHFVNTPFTVAASVEGAQTTGYSSVASPTNFFFAGTGNTGGTFNSYGNGSAQTYTNNVAPDVFFKVAADFGKTVHAELGGMASFFRDTILPSVAGIGPNAPAIPGAKQYNDTVTGGGAFGALRINSHYADFGVSGMVGDGVGRYGASQLADVTIHPNGTLEPIRNAHALISLETHPTPKFDVFGYYGGEYAQRTVYATGLAATPFTGYGAINSVDTGCNNLPAALATTGGSGGTASAANCSGVTRYISEAVVGFQYKPVIEKLYGQVLFRASYEYLTRVAWTGLTSGTYGSATATFSGPNTIDNMAHVSLRYILP
jgi:hypothetical protein